MIRMLHRWPGLIALVLVTILGLSGAILSVFPVAERIASPQAAQMSVAELAGKIQRAYPGVEQIKRAPSGQITAYWFDNGAPGAGIIDPLTGQSVGSADPGPVLQWLTNLHRSLFLDDGGRIAMALAALAMLVLAGSGAVLVTRRVGGVRRWFTSLRPSGSAPRAGRLHVEITRVAVFGLAFSALTALWMFASTFDMLPDGGVVLPIPSAVSGEIGAPVAVMDLLRTTPLAELRTLSFPYPDDATDVFTLSTDRGTGYLDQGTGALLAWADLTGWEQVSETIYRLHTGQGSSPLLLIFALLLGGSALSVSLMGVTGTIIWAKSRRSRQKIKGNAPIDQAETIVLVASEGGSTWGFAGTLHAGLTAGLTAGPSGSGGRVHVAPLAAFNPLRYGHAKRIIILAATYGDGAAPEAAKGVLALIEASDPLPEIPVAVLGFGDRSFPAFCAFARAVEAALTAKGCPALIPFDTVDRQSPQDFARWGRALGAAIGIPLELAHQPILPKTEALTLISRRDYGTEVQAPTAILRFALPRVSLWERLFGAGFSAGDLLGILPAGSAVPRFYSLASSQRDGFVEIVVRLHPGGLCSGQLLALEPGESVTGFVRANPGFRAGAGRAPLILIGAGTGVGPLAGFIRGNRQHRPVHLFFGIRHPDSDFLYGKDLADWKTGGQLTRLVTAVSRGARPSYVQDALRTEAAQVTRLIRDGARVMVCGGREMAAGVAEALTEVLAPIGVSPASLKAEGRYAEDVY